MELLHLVTLCEKMFRSLVCNYHYIAYICASHFCRSSTACGVVVYCTDTENWIPNSVEIQIADDYCEQWANDKPYARSGAIYGHLPAKRDRVVKRPGEWNRMRVKCEGQQITVELNGELVTEMDMSKWTSGKVNPDGTEIPSWLPKPFAELPTKGYIGLQGKHGNALIWFRNVEIRTLD